MVETKQHLKLVLHWIIIFLIIVYLILFGYNSLVNYRNFSPDSMNYVDVARNVAEGKGVSQSTLGFNVARFSVDDKIPSPFTSQPPLYPLFIVLFSFLGVSFADAALLVSIVSYGLLFIIIYLLIVKLYDHSSALFSLGILLSYYPLKYVSSYAFSESLGLVFVFLCLLLLIQIDRLVTRSKQKILITTSGLFSGLAFATRYALASLVFVCIIFLIFDSDNWKQRFNKLFYFVVGFIIPCISIIGHNVITTGSIFPSLNTSNSGLIHNLKNTFYSLFGNYLNRFNPVLEIHLILLAGFIILVLLGLRLRKKIFSFLENLILKEKRYILILWSCIYLIGLIYQRTRFHFDDIDIRLIVFAGIPLSLLFGIIIIKSTHLKIEFILSVLLILLSFSIKREIKASTVSLKYDNKKVISDSERLNWVDNYTSNQDLIIGDDTMDITFYLNRRSVVSFSEYPYSDLFEYNKLISFVVNNCNMYDHIYMVLRRGYSKDNIKKRYGLFIADIEYDGVKKYPGITLLKNLKDGYIFEILCHDILDTN
jgi:4-amino-4-deoxy-L-arabinose transferase-like glycosyltransferase